MQTPEPKDLTVNGCRLRVVDLGPRDAPVVIAHHGGGGIGSYEEPLATYGPLSDSYRVIVYDARGCGRSEAIPPYSHEQWADDLDAIRAWAGADTVTVCGGSYGGFIAQEYALAYPDRVDAIMLRDSAADGSNLQLAFANARDQDRVELDWENFDRYWSGRIRDDADLKQCWSEMIGLYRHDHDPVKDAEAVEAGCYRHEAHNWCFQHNWANYDLKDRLHTIAVPTLVTVGRHDWVTPVSCSETIASLVPNAELVIFENSGHSPQKEEYERFQQVTRDFMDRHVGTVARA